MMIKRIAVAASAALTFGLVLPAAAQTSKPIGLSLRVGPVFPSKGEAKDEGSTWFGFGADYRLSNLKFGAEDPAFSSYLTLSVDYYGKGDFYNVPVLVNIVGRNMGFYYGAGLGFGPAKFRRSDGSTKTNTEFGYQAFVGYDITMAQMPIFVEAKYIGSAKSDLNAFGVYAGVRF